jgi:hypothetical protein
MRYILFLSISVLLSCSLAGQQTFNDSVARYRYQLTENAMVTLGSWAAANIASGFIVAGTTQGEAKYAWRMNGYWNFVNLGLAGMGYLNARKAALKKYSFADSYEAQHSIEKLYILNFGLDLTYITAGFFLREKGNSARNIKSQDQLRGYGSSIILQGGFLLLMDGLMIRLHQKNTSRMNKKLRQFELNAGPGGLGISMLLGIG